MDQNVSYYGIKGFFMANSTMGQLSKFWIPHRAFYDRRAAFLRRGTSEHYRFSKRLRRILLILLIIFIVATVVAGIIIGTQNHSKQAENSSQVMNLALNGDIVGDIVQDIVEAILRILWLVLVYSVANLSIGMEEIFKWMGLANIIPAITHDGNFTVLLSVFVTSGIALFIIFFAFSMFSISLNKNSIEGQERLRAIPKQMFFAILILIMAAFMFTFLNSLINYAVEKILNITPAGNQSIPLYIYNCSFGDGIHHETSIDAWPGSRFIVTVGAAGQILAILILGYLNVTLLMSLIQLSFLYGATWLTLGSVARGDNTGFNYLISECKRKFITIIGLYTGYLLFQLILGVLVNIADAAHFTNNWSLQAFILIALVTLYLFIKWLPSHLSDLFDGQGMQGINASDAANVARSGLRHTQTAGKYTSSAAKGAKKGAHNIYKGSGMRGNADKTKIGKYLKRRRSR